MSEHINSEGLFQSYEYPATPAGLVPLATRDPMAQDLLWTYAVRRAEADPEFSGDLIISLLLDGYRPESSLIDTQMSPARRQRVERGGREVAVDQARRRVAPAGWVWRYRDEAEVAHLVQALRVRESISAEAVRCGAMEGGFRLGDRLGLVDPAPCPACLRLTEMAAGQTEEPTA